MCSNHQSRLFERYLRQNNIPYKISGGTSFFSRAEVKDTLAYIRLISNTADDAAFLRVINTPKRSIGATTLEKSAEERQETAKSYINNLQDMLDDSSQPMLVSNFARLTRPLLELCSLIDMVGSCLTLSSGC